MAAEVKNLKKVKEIGRKDILFSMARVPESPRIFFGSSDFKVYDLDLSAEKPEPKEMSGHQSYVTGVAYAGKYVISGAYDGRLIWWDREKHEQVRSVEAHGRWIRNVVASPDEKIVASVADDMVCRLWDVESGRKLHELCGHEEKTPHNYPSMLYACAISHDGKYVATGDRVGHVVVWEIASGKQVKTLEAPEHYTWDPKQRRHSIGGIRSLAFSPDGKTIAVGGMAKVGNIDHLGGKALLHLFAWEKGERLHMIESDKFKGLVEHLQFHHNGDWLLGAGGDHNGFVWFLEPTEAKTLFQDKAPMHVHSFDLGEKSDELYAVGHGKLVKWTIES